MRHKSNIDQTFEKAPTVEVVDALPPEFSDESLSQRFVRIHGSGLRYVAAWSRWYCWTGARWERDTTLAAFDRTRAICRAASSEAYRDGVKTRLASSRTAAAIEKLSKSDRVIAATVDQWDEDPDLFNTER